MPDLAAGVAPPLPRATAALRRRAVLWLAGLAVFFYAGYGLTNWLASQRSHVPVVVFDWEGAVPFLAWTIVPYWTTNLFFALSLFLCRTPAELDVHGRRLFTTQATAFVCFAAFPLRASFAKPATDGLAGFLFASLGSFDLPFNQAPSLHVALTTVLAALYVRVLPRWAGLVFLLWSGLVVASVLTTFQHHFIDIPTGFLLGLLAIWLWPMPSGEARPGHLAGHRLAGHRLANWRLTRDGRRRALAARYAVGGAALAVVGLAASGWALWLLWPAIALGAVAAAYLGLGPTLFGKDADGVSDTAMRLLLLPYRLGARLNAWLWTRREPARVAVADGVWLGRFPAAAECRDLAAVLDTTSEFPRRRFAGRWAAVPMLDLVAPEPAALRAAADQVETLRRHGPLLVCCALGYGRSAATLAVWLVRSGRQPDLAAALDHLRRVRPRLAINEAQRRAVQEAIDGA